MSLGSWYDRLGPDGQSRSAAFTAVRRMTRSLAYSHVKATWPDITEEEIAEMLHGMADVVPKQHGGNYDPHHMPFQVAAWLLGASTLQIARMFNVRPQTIQAKINKVYHKAMRHGLRIRIGLDYDQLGFARDKFYEALKANQHVFRDSTPREIADYLDALLVTQGTDNTQADPYDLPTPERRIGSDDTLAD